MSFAADDDERQQRLDRRTFDVMWKEEEEQGDSSGLMRLTQHEFYGSEDERHISFFETLPDVSSVQPLGLYSSLIRHVIYV